MKLAIDCDDAGLPLKQPVMDQLRALGVEVTDLKFVEQSKGDYPDIAHNLAKKVSAKEFDRGILICGTGLGMAMVANKVEGVFAGTCHDAYSAERLSKSNNAQVLTMGARVIGPELARMIAAAWVKSEFEGGRSLPKVERMREIEKKELSTSSGVKSSGATSCC